MRRVALDEHGRRLLPVLIPLGVARATQVVIHDDVLRRPRSVLVRRSNDHRHAVFEAATDDERAHWEKHPDEAPYAYLAKLLTCPWCVSIWLGLITVVGLRVAPRTTTRLLTALTASITAVIVDKSIDVLFPEDPEPQPDHEAPPSGVAAAFAQEG